MSTDLSESTSALAIVAGKPLAKMPADLFIPPDALEILLDSFSGPLDLLLYLIRRQDIDILAIPIVPITRQYMQYIQLMKACRIELAADYLVMAAVLAEIKSRLLLPAMPTGDEEDEDDPRLMLIRKLQVYERFKNAAIQLDSLPRCNRDVFRFSLGSEKLPLTHSHPEIELALLAVAMRGLMTRQSHLLPHQIAREPLSIRERMGMVLEHLQREKTVFFTSLFKHEEGRMGLVVTFLAVLELTRQSLLLINQVKAYTPIYLQAIHHE